MGNLSRFSLIRWFRPVLNNNRNSSTKPATNPSSTQTVLVWTISMAWKTMTTIKYRPIRPMAIVHFWKLVRLPGSRLASTSRRESLMASADESSKSMIASVNGKTSVAENCGLLRPGNMGKVGGSA